MEYRSLSGNSYHHGVPFVHDNRPYDDLRSHKKIRNGDARRNHDDDVRVCPST